MSGRRRRSSLPGDGRLVRAFAVLALVEILAAGAARALIDPVTGAIENERVIAGVPLGGLETGAVYWQSDGSIEAITCNNNSAHPIVAPPGCFFAVRLDDGARSAAKHLQLSSPYGWPTIERIVFRGHYPFADAVYHDSALAATLELRALSPLVPHNLEDSSLPVVLWRVRVHNPLKRPLRATVLLSWENLVGVGGIASLATSVRSEARQQFEAGELLYGVRMFNLAPAESPASAAFGDYAVTVVKAPGITPAAVVHWDAERDAAELWRRLETGQWLDGWSPSTRSVHRPACAVAATATIAAHATAECVFITAWHIPAAENPPRYTTRFPDAWSVADYAAMERARLEAESGAVEQLLHASSLPPPLIRLLINGAHSTTTHTSGGLAEQSPLYRLTDGTRLMADGYLLLFFPLLAKQELLARLRASRADDDVAAALDYPPACLRMWRWTGDKEFLDAAYPWCADLLSDQARASTRKPPPSDRMVAALRSLAALAGAADDTDTATRARQEADAVDLALYHMERQSADGRLEDLIGSWFSSLLGLAPPRGERGLRNWQEYVLRYHGPDEYFLPPAQLTTRGFERMESAAWLPHTWTTGVALQWHAGSTDAAWTWVQRAERAVNTVSRSPFEYGREYDIHSGRRLDTGPDAAAAAVWYLLPALLGLQYDAAGGDLTLAPRLPPGQQRISAPVLLPRWWGWMEYAPHRADEPLLTLTVSRIWEGDTVRLETLNTQHVVPHGRTTRAAINRHSGAAPFVASREGTRLGIRFTPPLQLHTGDSLALRVEEQ